MGVFGGVEQAKRRASLTTTALLMQKNEPLGRFLVQELSAGGAVLTGRAEGLSSDRVRVLLELPGGDAVRVPGTVIRRHGTVHDLSALQVAFRHSGPESEDAIQEAALKALATKDGPAALLAGEEVGAMERVRHELERLGRRIVTARTPLDVLRILGDPYEWIDLVVADGGWHTAEDLMEVLADEYPETRRVLFGGAPSNRSALRVSELSDLRRLGQPLLA
jgi:hypothetical protein